MRDVLFLGEFGYVYDVIKIYSRIWLVGDGFINVDFIVFGRSIYNGVWGIFVIFFFEIIKGI